MRVRQYVYFTLFSTRTTAAEMTAALGVEPDGFGIRGSRLTEPAVPAGHTWRVECREAGLCVDEQIACVLRRLRPRLYGLAALAGRLRAEEPDDGGAVLRVVRYFDESRPQESSSEPADEPDLFGWHLDRQVLAFLEATGAGLDVDEYNLTG